MINKLMKTGIVSAMVCASLGVNAVFAASAADIVAGDWLQWEGVVPLKTVDTNGWKIVPAHDSSASFEVATLEIEEAASADEYQVVASNPITFKVVEADEYAVISSPEVVPVSYKYSLRTAKYTIGDSVPAPITGIFEVVTPDGTSLTDTPKAGDTAGQALKIASTAATFPASVEDTVTILAYIEISSIVAP